MGHHCLRCLALAVAHVLAKATSAAGLTNSFILCACVNRQGFAELHLFNADIHLTKTAFESAEGAPQAHLRVEAPALGQGEKCFNFKGPLTMARCSPSLLCIILGPLSLGVHRPAGDASRPIVIA